MSQIKSGRTRLVIHDSCKKAVDISVPEIPEYRIVRQPREDPFKIHVNYVITRHLRVIAKIAINYASTVIKSSSDSAGSSTTLATSSVPVSLISLANAPTSGSGLASAHKALELTRKVDFSPRMSKSTTSANKKSAPCKNRWKTWKILPTGKTLGKLEIWKLFENISHWKSFCQKKSSSATHGELFCHTKPHCFTGLQSCGWSLPPSLNKPCSRCSECKQSRFWRFQMYC